MVFVREVGVLATAKSDVAFERSIVEDRIVAAAATIAVRWKSSTKRTLLGVTGSC